MDSSKESKRKKDKLSDIDDLRAERRSKKRRSRSRSPNETRDKDTRRKRRQSRSISPNRRTAQQDRRHEAPKDPDPKAVAPPRKTKETDMLNTRTGGAYIPPARLRMMQAQITDKSSAAYQRLAWEALKKSIHGHINKINVGNIGIIIKELLKENIVRGRGLLCRSVIQAQAASPTFTNVYAALVAAVNSRFPNIGELLLKRLVIQFKRGFKRNDKPICISSASFVAHLVNQRVAHEILSLELLTLLVETPTDDSVEVAIAFLKECGQKLTEVSSKGVNAIFEMLRNILHEGQLDKRVQYMIEVMFQVWKDGFKDHPAVVEELELVPEEEQFTHLLMLDDATDAQDILNVFKFDDKYEENEQKYKGLCNEILGSDAESGEEDGSGESGSEESEDEDGNEKPVTIIDNTETNLVALRRTIYLTINSSLDFEECAHKLMKMQLKPGQEIELCHMFLDCCAEQRTYEKFYGLLAQRFCSINRIYIGPFEEIFKDSYATAHRLDTNRLRNVSKFFAHLLFTDSISWEVLECVKLNEEDTTSSSRIYIKILFQELAEYMGLKKLNDRLQDVTLQTAFSGIFPRDNPKNTRFSINFFTSIGLGGLTDELREHLKQMPKNVPAPISEINLNSSSDSSSSSSDGSSSSDSSSSESEEDNGDKNKKANKSKKQSKTSKSPETTDPSGQKDKNERWGHDGFYDTYGKDARRTESRPETDRNNSRRDRLNPKNNVEERSKENDEDRNDRSRTHQDSRAQRRGTQESRKELERGYGNDTRYRDDRKEKNNEEESDRRYDRNHRNGRGDTERRFRSEDMSKRNFVNGKNDGSDDRYTDKYSRNRGRVANGEDQSRGRAQDHRNSSRIDNARHNKERREDDRDKNKSYIKSNEGDASIARDASNRKNMDDNERRRQERDDEMTHSKGTPKEKHKKNRYDEDKSKSAADTIPSKVTSKNSKSNDKVTSRDDEDRKGREHDDARMIETKKRNNQHKYESDSSDEDTKDPGEQNKKQKSKDKKSKNKVAPDNMNSKKRGTRKEKEISRDVSDTDTSDGSESDGSVKDLGGRYWDTFDIETKESSKKVTTFEERTPDKNDKYYERKRMR